jgi:hypothetical protein
MDIREQIEEGWEAAKRRELVDWSGELDRQ